MGMKTFELWNSESGSAIGEYATEAEALALVVEAIERNGRGYADMLFLGSTSRGRSKMLAQGQELVERALAAKGQSVAPHPAVA